MTDFGPDRSVARIAIKSGALGHRQRLRGLSLTQRSCGPDRAARPCRLLGTSRGIRKTKRYGMSGRGCGSLWFDVGSSDHLAPLLSLINYEGFKIGRGARKHRAT